MEEESDKTFKLASLLSLNSIDVRKVSRNDMSLLVGDYYALLSKLLSRAPAAKENLQKLTALNKKSGEISNDTFFINNFEHFRDTLELIGAEDLHSLAAEIVRLSKRGNKDYIAGQAKKLISNIDSFCTQLTFAQKEKIQDSSINILNEDDPDSETIPLYKAIKLLEQGQNVRKPQILAVDDSLPMLKTISSILADKYKVYGISNPLKVEEFLYKVTPDLILLDYKMPELSGFDLVPIIRGFDKHKNTPIIFLTSTKSSESVAEALKLGVSDYVVKPFQGNQLLEKIAKHIANRHSAVS